MKTWYIILAVVTAVNKRLCVNGRLIRHDNEKNLLTKLRKNGIIIIHTTLERFKIFSNVVTFGEIWGIRVIGITEISLIIT